MMTPLASMLTPPPLSPYGTLAGELFLYAGNRVAFESPLPTTSSSTAAAATTAAALSPSKCILLGGLSDGLMPVPYTQGLLDVCKAEGWSLVQPILSSSYTGFGHGSLDRDAAELVELVHYLREHRQAERVCFVGHSTGCQDIVHFLRTQSDHALFKDNDNKSGIVRGAVLQAAVSDREQPAAVDPASYTTHLQTAETMCAQGQGEAMMPRAAFWAPMTAQRFVDLQAVGGQDDYFSSDYTDAQLTERLQAAGDWPGLRMLVAFSGADEYVAAHIDRKLLTERLTAAVNAKCPTVATSLYLEPPANHNLSQGNVGTFLEHVRQLLAKITD